MGISDTYKLSNRRVLTGLFRNDKDVYQAQEILTDFGYPKDASKVVRLKSKPRQMMFYGKRVIGQYRDKIIFGASIGAVLILGALLAGMHFYSELNFSEMAILLVVWISLLALSAVACGLIGALIAVLISTVLAEEYAVFQKDGDGRDDLLVSVTVRTPTDAKDIAREWKEIGGEMLDDAVTA
jgi:hypothetical protein